MSSRNFQRNAKIETDHTCKYNSSIASKTRTTPTLVAKKYQSMKNDKVTAANCVIHSHSDRSPDCEGK